MGKGGSWGSFSEMGKARIYIVIANSLLDSTVRARPAAVLKWSRQSVVSFGLLPSPWRPV